MRTHALVAAALLGFFGLSAAQAETTIIEREKPDAVIVERPASESTTIEKCESSDGCSSTSVTKENDLGDRKTVTKETCD